MDIIETIDRKNVTFYYKMLHHTLPEIPESTVKNRYVLFVGTGRKGDDKKRRHIGIIERHGIEQKIPRKWNRLRFARKEWGIYYD